MTSSTRLSEELYRRTVLKASAVGAGALAGSVPATASDDDTSEDRGDTDEVLTQTADVIGQGPEGDVISEGGATIHRTADAVLMELSMPRPQPGEYTYPSGPPEREGEWWTDEVGDLEAFSLWAFVFNNPDGCAGEECSGDDVGEPAGGGVYNVAGTVPTGDVLALNGFVTTETPLYEDEGEPMGVPLERPLESEVHLAVAPHGAFDPAMMPDILQTPTGPGPDIWWIAIFEPE